MRVDGVLTRGLLVMTALCLGSCGETLVEEPITIPADHPCPDWGLPPESSSAWLEARASGQPVPLTLLPPLDEGLMVSVSQGTDQEPTHTGDNRWAWDLDIPLDTLVRAAAPGVVIYTRDDSDAYGPEPEFANLANLVTVDHGGGLYTSYVHLALDSVEVSP
ncbi:MAG: M23 family metallopeptidase, partial [Myxococcota bacterium]|nr:M23 family metallopeptidase [Myxococcota bacterium]